MSKFMGTVSVWRLQHHFMVAVYFSVFALTWSINLTTAHETKEFMLLPLNTEKGFYKSITNNINECGSENGLRWSKSSKVISLSKDALTRYRGIYEIVADANVDTDSKSLYNHLLELNSTDDKAVLSASISLNWYIRSVDRRRLSIDKSIASTLGEAFTSKVKGYENKKMLYRIVFDEIAHSDEHCINDEFVATPETQRAKKIRALATSKLSATGSVDGEQILNFVKNVYNTLGRSYADSTFNATQKLIHNNRSLDLPGIAPNNPLETGDSIEMLRHALHLKSGLTIVPGHRVYCGKLLHESNGKIINDLWCNRVFGFH